MNPLTQSKNTIILSVLIALTLACFELSPQAQAVCQDGCDNSLFNAFQGDDALINNTSGAGNSAFGWRALFSDSTGSFNTAVGGGALSLNNGDSNTAVGAAALLLNSGGEQNTAIGTDALVFNEGGVNSAVGAFALFSNTTGSQNTATGVDALTSNTTGNNNTATGFQALFSNTGNSNTAYGVFALSGNTTGGENTAIGDNAGTNATGDGNVYIGAGVVGVAGESDQTYIRNVNTTEQIPDADVAFVTVRLSDSRLGHQPITMRSASSELQKTVGELKSRVARQEGIIVQQQKAMENLTAQLREQATQIQKVSAQLELSKVAPQTVLNDQ